MFFHVGKKDGEFYCNTGEPKAQGHVFWSTLYRWMDVYPKVYTIIPKIMFICPYHVLRIVLYHIMF